MADKIVMYAYNNGSNGAGELSKAAGISRIKHSGSKFIPKANKILINWGTTRENFPENLLACTVLNHPDRVTDTANKLRAFEIFRDNGVSTPEFTTSREEALRWLESGRMVFARTQLRAHSGRGIEIMDPDFPDTWDVTAPLYTKYVRKKNEYRVHVARGQVIDIQRKGLREEFSGQPDVNWKIQNLANGFVYVRNDGQAVPDCVTRVAVQAVNALGLDFGAADIIYNQNQNSAFVLEVNTAPGLTGTTIETYVNFIRSL